MTVQHGGNVWQYESNILDFSASLSPLGMPKAVAEAAIRGVSDSVHYPDPDCTALRETIAEHEDVPADWVLCGNGAADLLDRLAHSGAVHSVLTPAPTFGEYERSFSSAGCKLHHFYLKASDSFQITEKLFSFLHPGLDLLILCSPNNPTGKAVPAELLKKTLRWCHDHHTRLLVDESFLDLADDGVCCDLRPFLKDHPELILLRSLTKSYCMPGLRLGYLLTSDIQLMERLKRSGQPWSVSVPAQYAGIAALRECPDHPFQAKPLIQTQRIRLKTALEAHRFHVFESHANYLLFHAEGYPDLREQLLEKCILIRSCASFRGLGEEYYRIAVRTEAENDRFILALNDILGRKE